MSDPRDTQDAFDTTLMGPGFFVFFQRSIIESAGYEPQKTYKHHPYKYKERVRFKFPDKEVTPIIERIAEQVVEPIIEKLAVSIVETRQSTADIELILRLKLEQEDLEFKIYYLTLLIERIRIERNNKAIILLLLN